MRHLFFPWDRIRKRAELQDFRLHDLRHSFTSFLVNDGEHLNVVQKLLGHTNPRDMPIYLPTGWAKRQKQVYRESLMGSDEFKLAERLIPALVLVANGLESGSRIGNTVRDDRAARNKPGARTHAVNLQVRDVEAHIKVLGDIPLCARANPPAGPVVVAARVRKCETARRLVARALQHAKDVIGGVVVADRCVAAVERRSPPRAPEVLIARIEAPRCGQLNVGR
jgi:Phage integrase family